MKKEEYNKTDLKICAVSLSLIALWLILCLNTTILGIILFILCMGFAVVLFISAMAHFNGEENNGKEGYYAQYGESFGANANKHKNYLAKKKLYIEEQIANEIMKGK